MAKLYITRASAGSGKTFRLTLHYLSHLFRNPDDFRHILAVTFTNKATEEMKSRIINVLHMLSSGLSTDYLDQLQSATGLDEKKIRSRSDIILKKILHNYSWFSVGTIDSFFLRVIRSFTREIGIQSGYAIELDNRLILGKAVDNLFVKIEDDRTLRDWIVDFASDRIEESKSWNLKREILNLGAEIFKESYKQYSTDLSVKIQDKSFLGSYKNELYKLIRWYEKTITDTASRAVEEMKGNNIEISDIYYKNKGPAGYFLKLSEGIIAAPNIYVLAVLQDSAKWIKQDSDRSRAISEICAHVLHPLLEQIVSFQDKNALRYNTAKTIFANLNTLGILSDITTSVNEYIRERNLFLISDAAQFINRIIDNNDAPFIYEKAGTYYHHFLIDEFQDTSGFQWRNFKPLISNSLSQGGNCLVVGDIKQSIYRWRNSNWEVLSKEIFTDFYEEIIQRETLNNNYRSTPYIVKFNNMLFERLPGILQDQFDNRDNTDGSVSVNENIRELYEDVIQGFIDKKNESGMVKIQFIDEEDYSKELVFEKLIETLNLLQDNNYMPGEIAILTRGRREGKEVADFLLEYKKNTSSAYKYDIVSDESLMLGSSGAVNFIVAVLRHLVEPGNDINNYFLLYEYRNYISKEAGNNEVAFMPVYHSGAGEESMTASLPSHLANLLHELTGRALTEVTRKIISAFELGELEGELAFIRAFEDLITNYVKHNSSNIPSFLEYWDETGKNKSISGTENQDAIRILTIHKSKGLEFSAVIMPFCDWKMEHPGLGSVLWCRSDEKPFDQIEILPVDYKAELGKTLFANDYYSEKLKNYIDNLNLLYVAFTRAKKSLFCFARGGNNASGKLSNVSQLLFTALSNEIQQQEENPGKSAVSVNVSEDKMQFELGHLDKSVLKPASADNLITINNACANDTLDRMKIAYQGKDFLEPDDERFHPVNYGKLLHELFSDINSLHDVDQSLEKMYQAGKIDEKSKQVLKTEIPSFFTDIQVNSWFSGDWHVLTERDIIVSGGNTRRPDRVLTKNDTALVIDFKFGEKELKEHYTQVMEYSKLISEMGFRKIEGYLWYVSKRKVVLVK